ncbi:MAG TPA: VOC family protein [Solirubrobacteraceae bacterium]
MPERTQYTPGTFSWADLATTDPVAAKAFYGELFGWVAEDMPVGDGVFYSMMRLDGKDVAGISPQPQAQREAGVPPLWNSYVTVESADASAARAAELGATVHAGPFDVMDSGRMAVIADPQGAYFMVWEKRGHFGAGLVNAPGALCWNELASPDPQASADFYAALFGWEISPMDGMPMAYFVIKNGDRSNGGITELPPGVPTHWLVYLATEEIDAAIAKAEELGATKLSGPHDIGIAKFAVIADPQGAAFALYAGQLDD